MTVNVIGSSDEALMLHTSYKQDNPEADADNEQPALQNGMRPIIDGFSPGL